jgi:putative transposase
MHFKEDSMTRRQRCYPSDVTETEWAILAPLLAQPRGRGRRRRSDMRAIINALFYLDRSGCQWRMLPREFPDWRLVYYYFRRWSDDGTLTTINTQLRRQLRAVLGRNPEPSAAILDSQSVRTTETGGAAGYDAGKQVNGRKRHILVDTIGLLLLVVVHAANIQDRDGARLLGTTARDRFPRLALIWADRAYCGTLIAWFATTLHWVLEIVAGPVPRGGFHVQPKRWIVERTFGWFNRYRRLSKDFEWHATSSEGMIYLASIRLMVAPMARIQHTSRLNS